ncbi:MAG: EamA family transporter [Oceanospirillaceae bacterium]|nr:EamA family transporter [Oceanospirillaceae bacterium]
MPFTRVVLLTTIAMVAFAGNSLLCRVALRETTIDPAAFTLIRLVSGALMLALIIGLKSGARFAGSGLSALALFAYAALFSYAYVELAAGMGALILFGAVQATMIGYGLFKGERFTPLKWLGLLLALIGLIGLMLPGLTAPPLIAALLMAGAGIAWGVYSLRGKGAGDPIQVSAGNFLLSIPFALALGLTAQFSGTLQLDMVGALWAVASGAVASALGYMIWYTALPYLSATNAATIQLSVPVLAAVAGVLLLNEALTLRLVLASLAILGGIALVIRQRAA